MTSSSLASSKFLLLADRPASVAEGRPKIRRYRLARLNVNERRETPGGFGHLTRSYD